MAQPQLQFRGRKRGNHVLGRDQRVNATQREEQVFADETEEAEVEEAFEILASDGFHLAQHADGLGADEERGLRVTGGTAHGGADDRDQNGLAILFRHAFVTGACGLVDVDLIVEGHGCGCLGVMRQEDGGEVAVGDAHPVERLIQRVAVGDLLEGDVLVLSADAGVDLRTGIGGGGLGVAQARGPADERAHGITVLRNQRICCDDVAGCVETEGFGDRHIAGGVLERQRAGRAELAGGGRHVHRLGKTGGEALVIGVERERVAELLRGAVVNDVERPALGVFVLLQNPAGGVRAAIGEGDAVNVVFDDRLLLSSSLHHWSG